VLRYYSANTPGATTGTSKNLSPTLSATTTGKDSNGNSYTEYSWSGQTAWRTYSDAKWDAELSKYEAGQEPNYWNNDKKAVYVDLGGIKCRVTTDKTTGAQTVTFTIPEDAMPTFYPDLYNQFYYEEMPARLIFKVGLSDAEIAKINASTENKTYYTNTYSAGDMYGNTKVAFQPAADNPYYKDGMTVYDSAVAKEVGANATQTAVHSFAEYAGVDSNTKTISVTQSLGNNGKLEVTKKAGDQITIAKQWIGNPPSDWSVKVKLYRSVITESIKGLDKSEPIYEEYIPEGYDSNEVTITAANNSTVTVPAPTWDKDAMTGTMSSYSYYVVEELIEGYTSAYYLNDSTTSSTGLTITLNYPTETYGVSRTEQVTVYPVAYNSTTTITNTPSYTLPNSGGEGTFGYTVGGTLIMVGATAALCIYRRTKLRTRGRGGVSM
jgi:hypothetical protein